jgi:hypothetical protein
VAGVPATQPRFEAAGRYDFVGLFTPRSSLRFAPQQCADQPTRIKADRCGDLQEFQHVQAPIPTLIFRHVGWRLAEPLGEDCLRQTCCLPPGFEQLAEPLVWFGVDGLRQIGTRTLGFRSKSFWQILPKWEKVSRTVVRFAVSPWAAPEGRECVQYRQEFSRAGVRLSDDWQTPR